MAMTASQHRIRNEFRMIGNLHSRGFIGHPVYSADGSTTVTAFLEGRINTPFTNELLIVTMTFSNGYPYQRPMVSIELLNRADIAQHIETLTGHFLEQNWTAASTIDDVLNFVSR